MKLTTLFTALCLGGLLSCPAQNPYSPQSWVVEDASASAVIVFCGDTIEITSPQGLTMWYDKPLSGNYTISYRAKVIMQDGEYDRLSDLNCFWGANDPENPNDIYARKEWRNGKFMLYRTLNLFYVGYGGNNNTSTRFRRYYAERYGQHDDVVRPVIKEYLDPNHLLKPNRWYSVVITADGSHTTFSIDGEELFRTAADYSLTDGYFGLRHLSNHILITDFTATALPTH